MLTTPCRLPSYLLTSRRFPSRLSVSEPLWPARDQLKFGSRLFEHLRHWVTDGYHGSKDRVFWNRFSRIERGRG